MQENDSSQVLVQEKLSDIPLSGEATLHGLFETQAAKSPEAIALTCNGESLSYAELNSFANRLARRLVECGVKPDTLVGVCLDRSNQLIVAVLAILKAGGAYLPIDLAYPAERLAFMLDDAKAPVLLTETRLAGKLPAHIAITLYVDELLANPLNLHDAENLPVTSDADHLAYTIYTSGTTGKPKGSLITHRNVVRLFSATDHWYGFGPQDVWTMFHSVAFDFSVWEIWGALLYGGRLVVVPFLVSRSPDAFYELLSAEHITVLNQTPSAFRQLIRAEERVGQKELALRYVIFGGEALEMHTLRPWYDRHGDRKPQLINMYGITETTVHVTYRALSETDLTSGSVIGVPIPDLQVHILDANLRPVATGETGEMYVSGAGLARGYLNRPDLTAQRFLPDHISGMQDSRLYKTGDLARFLSDGDLEYFGRIDDQVKIRGFRIELGEIESVLCQHAGIREAVVMARDDASGGKRLVAYLVATQPAPAMASVREHLKKQVPDYMVPAAFMFLENLPLTTNGKVDRKALPEPVAETESTYVAPQTDLERQIAEVWRETLNIERVSVESNFFELGGNSLSLVEMHRRLRETLNRDFPMVTLFEHPTVRAFAAYLEPPAASGSSNGTKQSDRAQRQKAALEQMRSLRRRN